jgi:hypothetical protein
MITMKIIESDEISSEDSQSLISSEFFKHQYPWVQSMKVEKHWIKLHNLVLWIQWLSGWMSEFKIGYQYHQSFVSSQRSSLFIAVYLETLPWCANHCPEELYVNLSHNYFTSNINRSLSQDQNLAQLQYDTLRDECGIPMLFVAYWCLHSGIEISTENRCCFQNKVTSKFVRLFLGLDPFPTCDSDLWYEIRD